MDTPTSLPTRAPIDGDTAKSDASRTVVSRLIEVIRLRDPELADHGQRAANVAAAIAAEMGLDTATIDHAYLGAQLHDIGKLGVAEAVLWKPAGLSRTEWAQIRTHPEKGHRLVADIVHPDVAAAVLSHHERLDGAGYPFGIDSRSLPMTVHIVQVAAFRVTGGRTDPMTSDRPYEGALAAEISVAEIRRCAGTQFDPDAAAALATLLALGFEHDAAIDLTGRQPVPSILPADPFSVIG